MFCKYIRLSQEHSFTFKLSMNIYSRIVPAILLSLHNCQCGHAMSWITSMVR